MLQLELKSCSTEEELRTAQARMDELLHIDAVEKAKKNAAFGQMGESGGWGSYAR